MLAAAISGYKFLDENCDGIRNTDLIQGSSPDVVFVVDVSSSTAVGAGAIFVGQSIGDVNSDGVSNTILDAELAGFIALNRQLIAQGLGDTADVGIVLFGGNAVRLDVGTASGDQITIKPNADLNANGVKDIEELLSRILHGGQGISSGINGANTNYEAALQEVIGFFNGLGTATGNGNMVFLTDGRPNSPSTSTTVYADEVDVLEAAKVNLNAFGAGGTSEVPPLQVIDPDAVRFDSTDELLAAFNGLQGSKTSFKEPGLAGVKIWLDIDRDGILDADEPFAISAVDNPGTAVDETGNYRFDNLPNGIYDVREVVPPGMIQTAPAGGFTTVNVSTNGNYNVYFGNRPGEIAGIKWSDLNGNGVRDRLLVGDEPDVVFVIDVSGSTTDSFVGSQPVGDVNGDGSSNTILDAEIAGFIALNQSMINAGFGVVGTVSIIAFETSAISLDLDPKAPGVQISTTPSADLDGNGVRDIEQALRQLRPLGSTNYEGALSQALTVFGILGTPSDQSNLIFLSDGAPNSPGAHSDEVG
ncbi:MAG: VWA domain-containing protein, partial [Planctomycetota bacterium]